VLGVADRDAFCDLDLFAERDEPMTGEVTRERTDRRT
jgi:hypothetical protein